MLMFESQSFARNSSIALLLLLYGGIDSCILRVLLYSVLQFEVEPRRDRSAPLPIYVCLYISTAVPIKTIRSIIDYTRYVYT